MKISEGEMCHFSICPQSIPQHKHVKLEETAMPTDLLILVTDSRLIEFKKEDIQLKLMEDNFSVDPRTCYYICNWRILNFNWQFAEISTEKACSATSTNVLGGGMDLHWKSNIILYWPFQKHFDNIHSTHYPKLRQACCWKRCNISEFCEVIGRAHFFFFPVEHFLCLPWFIIVNKYN